MAATNPACWVSSEPSLAGFRETQPSSNPAWLGLPCWVPTRPNKLGSTLGFPKSSKVGFRRTLLGLVEPSLAGFPRTQLLGLTRPS
ncbi:hypothetical protein SLEP1_g16880 [Rubroshorea leprosula]|uniref:Uncharacterized protein n=1 Tax=Rubroshorea leprosula TaxID=152421 RepID=A0AAV5J2T8_9ROSI|nr:hypothetical protein SLEP1_g16880 [Rubroshorea leprosula]